MAPAPDSVFDDVLARQRRADGSRPLVTYYDLTPGGTGERTELSVTTYANWVAKTASLLVEECGLERGDTLRVDLPGHWLGPVVLGAAWTVGLVVLLEETDHEPHAVVCGPDGVARWSERADGLPVLATALLPLGRRFADPLPSGVLDLGVEVWGQPDAFTAWDPPSGADEALPGLTQERLWRAAAAGSLPGFTDGGRLLTEANPASPPGLASFTEPLARGGSVVLLHRATPDQVTRTYLAEHATARW